MSLEQAITELTTAVKALTAAMEKPMDAVQTFAEAVSTELAAEPVPEKPAKPAKPPKPDGVRATPPAAEPAAEPAPEPATSAKTEGCWPGRRWAAWAAGLDDANRYEPTRWCSCRRARSAQTAVGLHRAAQHGGLSGRTRSRQNPSPWKRRSSRHRVCS